MSEVNCKLDFKDPWQFSKIKGELKEFFEKYGTIEELELNTVQDRRSYVKIRWAEEDAAERAVNEFTQDEENSELFDKLGVRRPGR
ncbi:hypothetical protein LTR09_009652 [Extremus antarcticus]|uniref:RRM domain-containing protein n=1 Tax=Extremus antarcticus TaxID=702011 RepID=A0AAJ0DF45_9PEZI|nr:hypothetical protein LTR09_009652 [Extremus antarcticus]